MKFAGTIGAAGLVFDLIYSNGGEFDIKDVKGSESVHREED